MRTWRVREVLGVLALDRAGHRLCWGPLAGRGRGQPLDEWKSQQVLVRAADLHPGLRESLGLRLPHERLAPSLARAALEALPALVVHESLWEPLSREGCHLLRVGYSRYDSSVVLETRGPTWPALRLQSDLGMLQGRLHLGPGALCALDRLVRAATRGQVDELAVRTATWARRAVDGLLVDPEGIKRRRQALQDLRELEAALGEDLARVALQPDPPPIELDDREAELRARAQEAGTGEEQELVARLVRGEAPGAIHLQGRGRLRVHPLPPDTLRVGEVSLELPASSWVSAPR